MALISVDLPLPFVPSKATIFPLGTSIETPCRTFTAP